MATVGQMQNESRLTNPRALTIADQHVTASGRVKCAGSDGRQASHHIRSLAVAGVKRGDLGARPLGAHRASNYVQLGANHAADLAGVVQGCDKGLGDLPSHWCPGAGRRAERGGTTRACMWREHVSPSRAPCLRELGAALQSVGLTGPGGSAAALGGAHLHPSAPLQLTKPLAVFQKSTLARIRAPCPLAVEYLQADVRMDGTDVTHASEGGDKAFARWQPRPTFPPS